MSTLKSNNEDMTINADGASSEIILQQNATERMRIDSSGKVLVGNDTGALATAGVSLRQNWIRSVRDGDIALQLNRLTSDGDIAQFRKDGTTVGSIGSYAGLYTNFGTSDVGLMFNTGAQAVIPHNMSTNVPRDNALNLGQGGYRWKDLYLSGGVYLGGTGSANKLDDYEEGTWTPTNNGGTVTINNIYAATFTKIGNKVHLYCFITLASDGDSTGFQVGGLPFVPATNHYETGQVNSGAYSGEAQARVQATTSYARFYKGNTFLLENEVAQNGEHFIFSVTYRTDS